MTRQSLIVGAVLAGGQSRRFGSDKALALLDGTPLIEHVAERLAVQTDRLIVVGRTHPGLDSVPDRPSPGLGPLGAIAGALHWARTHGYAVVLTAPCDTPHLPPDLSEQLCGPVPCYAAGCPVLGWWPAALADHLDAWLRAGGSRAVRHWAEAVGARLVTLAEQPANVNTPADLAQLRP